MSIISNVSKSSTRLAFAAAAQTLSEPNATGQPPDASSTKAASTSRWKDMPDDLLVRSFSKLSPPELARLNLVTPGWRAAANAPDLWRGYAASVFGSTQGDGAALKAAYARGLEIRSNIQAGRVSSELQIDHKREGDSWFRWSPDGSKLARFESRNMIRVIDATTGDDLARIHGLKEDQFLSQPWSRDSTKLLTYCGRIIPLVEGPVDRDVRSFAQVEAPGERREAYWLPDGRISYCSNAGVHVADGTTGREVARHKGEGRFSPSPNGRMLHAESPEGTLHVVDAARAVELWSFRSGKDTSYFWSPDSSRVVVVSSDALYVLNARDGSQVARVGTQDRCTRLCWSGSGGMFAFAPKHCPPRILTRTGAEVAVAADIAGEVGTFVWNHDGTKLAVTVSCPSSVHIVDGVTGAVTTVKIVEDGVRRYETNYVSWSPDGKKLAVDHGGAVHIADANSGQVTARISGAYCLKEGTGDLSWNADGSRLIVQAWTGGVIADTSNGRIVRSAWGHDRFRWSPDTEVAVLTFRHAQGWDWNSWRARRARIIDPTDGRVLANITHEPWSVVSDSSWSPDGSILATGTSETLRLTSFAPLPHAETASPSWPGADALNWLKGRLARALTAGG